MPPLRQDEYLPGYLTELGFVVDTGLAVAPISFSEIDRWSTLTRAQLGGWAAYALRKMSEAYVSEYQHAKDEKTVATPPWLPEMTEERQNKISSVALQVFG